VEEAFEAGLILPVGFDTGCGISGTDSTYLSTNLRCQALLVELGVAAELIVEKLLVTQTGKRLLECEK
jgi:hypothetical protein